jgi:hypothetical protein
LLPEKKDMNDDQNQPKKTEQVEAENDQKLSSAKSDATLVNKTPKQAESSIINATPTSAPGNYFTQSVIKGSEITPEFGDSEDPTFEVL